MKTLGIFILGLILGAVGIITVQTRSFSPAPVVDRGSQTKGDIQLTLRAEYLARVATDQVKKLGLPITLQDVRLVPRAGNQLALVGKVAIYGINVPATVTMQPSIARGQLRIAVTRTDVESLPVPGELGQQLENAINAELDKIQRGISFRITGLQVTDEGVVLEGVEQR